jgi:diphthine-ammonia ligase
MMQPLRYAVSWSGGKDSALALWRLWQRHGPPQALVTTLIDDGSRTRSHHLRPEVLRAQVAALGLPLVEVATSLPDYRRNFGDSLARLREETGISAAVFGDIDLEAHRSWFRAVCAEHALECLHPLWEEAREALLAEFLSAGFVTRIAALQEDKLDARLLGRVLDTAMLDEFRSAGIDLCGEKGEYHTVVVDGPCFTRPLALAEVGRERADGYCFVDFSLS